MSTATTALQARYQLRIDDLTDSDAEAEADAALELWKLAADALVAMVGKTLQSHSETGRSILNRQIKEAREQEQALKQDLLAILGEGDHSFYDLSQGTY